MAVVTKTLKSSGGDYSSIITWESSEQTNLVTDGDTHVLECDTFSGGLYEQVQLSGWTTDATHFITIKAAAGHEHGGVIKDGFYLRWDANNTYCFDCAVAYTVFEDIEIWNEDPLAVGTAPKGIQINANYITMDRCIIGINPNAVSSYNGAVRHYNYGGTLFRNCLIISMNGVSSNAAIYSTSTSTVYRTLQNCTIIQKSGSASAYALYTSGASSDKFDIDNCAFYSGAGNDFYINNSNALNFTGDYNAHRGTDQSSYLGANSFSGLAQSDWADYYNDDFSIDNTSALYDAGQDMSADYTTDIAGVTYATDEIGAYAVAGTGGPLNNKRISSMHFQRHYEPIAIGED